MSLTLEKAVRVFRFNGRDLQDPDQGQTPEQVKDFYAGIYPELTNAAIEGPETKGATTIYEFRKAVGTKGSAAEGMQVGRLAMRVEGNFWGAYYAQAGSMEGAVPLGTIGMGIVSRDETKRDRFFNLMRDAVADFIEDKTGQKPTWGVEERAPEHERAGHG
jgi:PRTRC genetic system protein C